MPSKATANRPVSRPFGPPMLCSPLDEVPNDPDVYAQIKYDGWRTRATVAADGVTLTSREGKPITAVLYVERALGDLTVAGTVLDGELVDLAGPRQLKRTGEILASAAPHMPSAASPPLTFAIFDLLMCADEDLRELPLHDRLARLAKLFENPEFRPHTKPLIDGGSEPTLLLVAHRPCTPEWAQQQVDAGQEGVVMKLPDSRYVHGARNRGWWKWKPQQTLDAQCTRVVPGRAGAAIGSLGFRLASGIEGTVSSGISELEWLDMTSHPERYVGRMLELSYLDIEGSGLLRSPVYRGTRHPHDKAAPAKAPRTPRRLPDAKVLATAARGGKRKRRSYEKMGDDKLLTCISQLRTHTGDAYNRCLERGSGDPAGDLAFALAVAHKRGLGV